LKNVFLKNYKNLKVLITGTTGFKGSWLAFWLQNLGARVYGVSLKPEKNSILFKSFQLDKKINQYFTDINNFNNINEIVKKIKPDIIFHLAAQSIVSESFKMPLKTFQTNILGSANILETTRINHVPHLVYITSDKCYLNLDKKKNYKETDILGGIDNYSSSKASAELIFSSYFNSFFSGSKYLSIASVRAGNVIGGGDMKDNRIVPDIIKALHNDKKLNLRNPRATRPWQHVLEPLFGYLLLGNLLLEQRISSNVLPSWNFGPKPHNCKKVSIIVKLIERLWNKKKLKIKYVENKSYHESKLLSLNIKKANKELNWEPKLSLNDTMKLTVEWYKNYFSKQSSIMLTNDQIEYFLDQ
jgi:CDP-glucose 4,6-dehydratase